MLIVKVKKSGTFWLRGTSKTEIKKGDEFHGKDAADLIAAGYADDPATAEAERKEAEAKKKAEEERKKAADLEAKQLAEAQKAAKAAKAKGNAKPKS